MNKKICIINKVSALNHRSFYKDGLSLARAGYEVCILGFYSKDEIVQGVRLVSFEAPKRRLARFFVTNYRVFRRALREKADIYHFHDLDFVPWAVLLKFFTRARVVYCIREAHPEYMMLKTYLPKGLRRCISFLIYLMEHVAIRFYDAIIPCDNYVSNGFRHKNNTVIFHFPGSELFKNENGIPWQARKYDLFYHGSVPKYHFETMMKIAERLSLQNVKNVWGIVMNEGSPLVWAKEEVKKRGLENNFVFLPYVTHGSVGKYLVNAKIGIIPLPPFKKFMKNIPVKMFEFMGFGMPVVLSDLPPSRQFIKGESCAIAVEPDNINHYAEAIKSLLQDPEMAIKMGEKGRQLITERYNWGQSEKKLLSLYAQLLN